MDTAAQKQLVIEAALRVTEAKEALTKALTEYDKAFNLVVSQLIQEASTKEPLALQGSNLVVQVKEPVKQDLESAIGKLKAFFNSNLGKEHHFNDLVKLTRVSSGTIRTHLYKLQRAGLVKRSGINLWRCDHTIGDNIATVKRLVPGKASVKKYLKK